MDVLDEPVTDPVVRTIPVLSRVAAQADAIARAASLLADAHDPLILVGDEIAAAGAQTELAEVARLLGARVLGGNDSETNVPAGLAGYGGQLGHMFGDANRAALVASDVVLVCGTTLFPEVFPALDSVFAPQAKLVHLGLNAAEIGKTWPVTVGALGDPKPTLVALLDALHGIMTPAQLDARRARWRLLDQSRSGPANAAAKFDDAPPPGERLRLGDFAKALAARLPKDSIIFDEALTSSPGIMRHLPAPEPGGYFQTRAGMLGSGLPGAIGLKIAHPDRMVVGLCGDGGGMSTIQALATAARHGIGAKFIVCNNRCYQILKDNLREYRSVNGLPDDPVFPESFDLAVPALRFDLLAQAQGVTAMRVERTGEIAAALDAAFARSDEPFLIELMLPSSAAT